MSEPREAPKDKEPVGPKPDGPRSIPAATPSSERGETSRTAPATKTGDVQLVVTLKAGEVSKVESLEAGGRRRELSPDECVALIGEDDADDIEELVMEVYRTAVADILGDGEEEDELDLPRGGVLLGRISTRRMLRRGIREMLLLKLFSEKASSTNRRN